MRHSTILKPLEGVRVLDFTAHPPGGACTVMLADLGAEVVRVESPSRKGKPSLVVGQMALSRGKRSLTLDMRNPDSTEILKRLAPEFDVIVEGSRPGSMQARGFGYPQCEVVNPGIIWCAMTGFGQTGPYAEYSGHDLSYLAHSGLLGALSADLPWHPGISLSLQAGALCAVVAIQSGLIQRGRTGKGSFIDLSLSESTTWFLTCGINPLSDSPLFLPATPDRRLYRCADGRFLAVACAEPRTWDALCDGLGLPELKPYLHKAEHASATAEVLAETFSKHAAKEWVSRLAPAGAAVTVVNHAVQLHDDPQVQARHSVVEVAGTAVPASPIRLTSAEGGKTGTATDAPHRVGDDTVAILETAGFSTREIGVFERSGLI